jgi:outer membrane lipoprotein-sorting protein
MKRVVFAIILILVWVLPTYAAKDDAEDIIKKADERYNLAKDMIMTMKMTVVDKKGETKVRELNMWQKGTMRLIQFTAPAGDKGIAFLAIDANSTFVYLPAYKKIRRIASHVRNQTFMGTDFSYEDMSATHWGVDYSPKLIDQTDTHWTLEMTPRPGAVVGYSKLRLKITKSYYEIERIEYFNDKGEYYKLEERTGFELYEGKFRTPSRMTMTSLKDNHKTIADMVYVDFDSGLTDELFTRRSLKRPVR